MSRTPEDKKQGRRGDSESYSISGEVSGGIVIQGPDARVNIVQESGTSAEELVRLFELINKRIQERPDDPDVEKEEIKSTVNKIEAESKKGEAANETKLERWLAYLNEIAPDIADVFLASLGGPASGMTAVLQKVVKRASKQAGDAS